MYAHVKRITHAPRVQEIRLSHGDTNLAATARHTWQLGARASVRSPDGSCTEELIDYADPVGEEQAEGET